MSFSRRSILLIAPALLAGCGFAPVYGTGGAAAGLRGKIVVDSPEAPDDYLLVQDLEETLGRAAAPLYRLSVALRTSTQGQAVTAAGDITRFSLVGQADYTLRAIGTDTIIASGSVDNFTGYSATGSTVETLAAERDARARLMRILADQIATRLYATVELPA